MHANTQYCQPDLYSSYLHTIKGIKFTRRQVDILTCLSTGRDAKTIANFLQIDAVRTIHAHELYIRGKLECGSRNDIINFLEHCEEYPALKKYHQILKTHFAFEKAIQKIAALVGQTHHKLMVICKDLKEPNTVTILNSLEYYLKQAGIKVSVQKRATADLMNVPFLILDEQTVTQHHEEQVNFDFKDLNSFYLNLFELIKKVVPNVDLTKIEVEFKKEYAAIHNGGQSIVVNTREPAINTKAQKKSWSYFFTEKNTIAIAVSFLCLSILSIWLLMGETKQKDIIQTNQSIRSDLIIPTDSALLKRPELIKQIEQKLNQQKGIQTVALVGIVGMGGVGKTTLARYFGKLQDSSLVWEINAETKEGLMNSFKDLAYAFAKTKKEEEKLEFIKYMQNPEEKEKQLLSFVKNHLRTYSKWMLIYDNVAAFTDIKDYLPQDSKVWGNGKVIITTRDSNIQNTSYISPENVIQLGELSQSEALTLFSKILYNCELNKLTIEQKEQALSFLKNIPSFPLDVSVAAYYIKDTHISYEQYLERIARYGQDFETIQTSFLKEGSEYEKTRYGIISLSLKKLIELNSEFKDFLFFICLLDSQNIPVSLLEEYKDSKTVDSFMHALRKYSLITSETSTGEKNSMHLFNLHRSTQCLGKEFLLSILNENEKINLISNMVTLIQSFYKKNNAKNHKLILLIIPHLEGLNRNLIELNIKEEIEEKWQQKLFYILGYAHYRSSENLILVRQYFMQTLKQNLKYKTITGITLANMLKDLGSVCVPLNFFEESITYSKKSLELCKIIPNSEMLIAENLKNMGDAYATINKFDEAKYYYENAINKASKVHDGLELLSNIYGKLAELYSTTYINKEKGYEAKDFAYKSLEILNGLKTFYNVNPKTLSKLPCYIAMNKVILGRILCRLAQYNNAMEQGFKDAEYIIYTSLDNCSHNISKMDLFEGIGQVKLREGKLREAKNNLSKAIQYSQKLIGENDTYPARILKAEVLIRLGEFEEAYKECIAVYNIKNRFHTNFWNLLYLTIYYHAAFIKYKQNDLKKSIEHFADFFKGMQEFCKGFLEEKDYKNLENKGAFEILAYDPKNAKEDIKKYLKNSVNIFTAIYGSSHPFVKDYIVANYNEAVKPWYKFW